MLKLNIVVRHKTILIRNSVLSKDGFTFTPLLRADFLGTIVIAFFRLTYTITLFLFTISLINGSIRLHKSLYVFCFHCNIKKLFSFIFSVVLLSTPRKFGFTRLSSSRKRCIKILSSRCKLTT